MLELDKVHWVDIVILTIYFLIIVTVGLWTLFRPDRSNVKSYFLAGRSMSWFPVGGSLYASNIGSEHFIGLAGTGAAAGIAIVAYEWTSMPLAMLLTWFFLPVYITAGVFTLPEYIEKRFASTRLRVYLSCIALILYVVTKIAIPKTNPAPYGALELLSTLTAVMLCYSSCLVCIYAGALFIQISLGWNMYVSIVSLLIITALYTLLGGLAAVIYTDAVQTVVMTAGAIALCIISFIKIGGYENLKYQYLRSVPTITTSISNHSTLTKYNSTGTITSTLLSNSTSQCGYPRADSFHIFRDPVDSDNPWPGLIFQSSIGCIWYWCADQVIVQRALAAKNLSHAKAGSILAGYLKITPLFLMIFPGMISRTLYPDEVGCVVPEECTKVCGIEIGCSNIAYPLLVMTLLPIGLRGLLLAVMMSAIMSSLTSIFNSASTLFTMDLWQRVRPSANQRELLIVGRVVIVVLSGVSILWIPLLQSSAGGQLFVYIQSIQGYLGTPIGAIFLLAVFSRRITEIGAGVGLAAGHISGITRMILDFVYPGPACDQPDTRPPVVADIHYTYFSMMNFAMTIILTIVVSLLTKPRRHEELIGLTWWSKMEKSSDETNTKENKSVSSSSAATNSTEISKTDIKLSVMSNGDDKISVQSTESSRRPSAWRRWFNSMCGLPDSQDDTDPEEKESVEDRQKLLKEKTGIRRILNVNAIIALSVMVFMFGFYY